MYVTPKDHNYEPQQNPVQMEHNSNLSIYMFIGTYYLIWLFASPHVQTSTQHASKL